MKTSDKHRAYQKAYNKAHKDEIKAYQKAYRKTRTDESRAYREAHKDERKANNKAYRKSHKDDIKASNKARYEAHRDDRKTYQKAYNEVYPEVARLGRRKYRALKRGASHEPYTTDYVFERDNWMCQICGRKINKRLKWPNPQSKSIDHIIPLSRGGNDSPLNVQAAHLRCNVGKNATNKGQLRLFA